MEDLRDLELEGLDTTDLKTIRRMKKKLVVSDLSTKLKDKTRTKSVYSTPSTF